MNQEQAEKLYNIALSYADLKGNETVIDAHCGTGTISLYLAQKAKHVIGIEIIPAAIENAEKKSCKKRRISCRLCCRLSITSS
ncbi:methyltransferase domain-containing protein [Megasphaera hutchinsoni]|uniref:methyltransferase domain-containing protein n=1 Tax=Megasphaera hutchinsoni TaxID=1588748 RepID=UPI0009301E5E|nr:methyltransferase domain-containing protein [Megasphaera hutchinsoni]